MSCIDYIGQSKFLVLPEGARVHFYMFAEAARERDEEVRGSMILEGLL